MTLSRCRRQILRIASFALMGMGAVAGPAQSSASSGWWCRRRHFAPPWSA